MFYTYNQNNSGGRFVFDKTAGITHYVIIEANSPAKADARAMEIGLYFDGCSTGDDCSCCGDRWYTQYGDGDAEPSLYGEPIQNTTPTMLWMDPKPEAVIHYADGRIEWVTKWKEKDGQ